MFRFFVWLFDLFSPYANSFERKVDRFFRGVKSTDSILSIKERLLKLMGENLIVVNVWLEKKFKGYTYLSKRVRRKMYSDVEKIVKKLMDFASTHRPTVSGIKYRLSEKGIAYPLGDDEKIKWLTIIMEFLKPGHYYHYVETSSFGKLLRDPDKEKLEGDCNQIVTLYVYLYSLKFPVENLQIKLLPEHVCLHFRGVDIEATNGTFQKYKDQTQILPVTEIISTNLLDLTDFRENVQDVSPRDIVKSAQLAYAVSSLKSLVTKNLNIAYKNLAIGALRVNDFETAIYYFSEAGEARMLNDVYKRACVYYMDQENFSKAKFYADKSGDSSLTKAVSHNEGVYRLGEGNIDAALKIFKGLDDDKMVKACYAEKYNDLVVKVKGDRTLAQAKAHKYIYKEMLDLVGKMGDEGLKKSVRETLSKL
ncbi:MAG: hypothetical protein V1679_02525 [Candidatus Peregrinibacteria bacterium]